MQISESYWEEIPGNLDALLAQDLVTAEAVGIATRKDTYHEEAVV
jgi:hypothetical protein